MWSKSGRRKSKEDWHQCLHFLRGTCQFQKKQLRGRKEIKKKKIHGAGVTKIGIQQLEGRGPSSKPSRLWEL